MGESRDQNTGRAAELIDALVLGHRELARAQARSAALMMEFAETRSACDRLVIAEREAGGVDVRYKAGEFAGTEISMALRESKHSVQHTMAIARRLRADTPDAWDAWQAGDITYDKAERISRTLGKLVRDNSKALLNHVVVDVAVCKTGELLGRWLNQFVARVEPDEQDERIHRSLADRYVSVRPDLDGVSFLSAALSSLDAASIDRVLTAIAVLADPSDTRTLQQRRADALVDVLLGRISNGCHTRWDGNETNSSDDHADHDDRDSDDADSDDADSDDADSDDGGNDDGAADNQSDADTTPGATFASANADGSDDWDLPASAFRPDPPHSGRALIGPTAAAPQGYTGSGAPTGGHPCTCGRGTPARPAGVQIRPVQVNIGVIISAASLLGFSNTPGQLADRSALIPADTIRDLAAKQGTLFHAWSPTPAATCCR